MENLILLLSFTVKGLLFNTKPSTDFEVHRNWKDITTSTSVNNWYNDERSIWTLDYPPLFAYLEYILGSLANLMDYYIGTKININQANNLDSQCIIYQRITSLLLGDLSLFLALKHFTSSFQASSNKFYLFFNILMSGGLLVVDNIHFQYNAFLYGILILSISFLIKQSYIKSAICFSVLLNFKHIFLYFAPAFFVYILKYFVFSDDAKNNSTIFKLLKSIGKFILTGISVIIVFGLSFLPFLMYSVENKTTSNLIQIGKRLFPVSRGLMHSYWAPNFYSIYNFLDKAIYTGLKYFGKISSDITNLNKSSLGVVQISEFNVLPNITAFESNILVISLSLILITYYLYSPQKKSHKEKIASLFKLLLLSVAIFFNFGYHVHEKAILNISFILLLWSYSNSVELVLSEKVLSKEEIDEQEKSNTINEGIIKNKGIISNKNNRMFLFFGSKNQILMTSCFELEIIAFLVQLPLIHEIKDYYTKLIVIFFILILKYQSLRTTIKSNITYLSTFYQLIVIWVVVSLLIVDFIYVIILPYIKAANIDDLIKKLTGNIEKLKYFNYFEQNTMLLEVLYQWIMSSVSFLLKFEFLPLMYFSVVNAVFLQINLLKILIHN